MADDTLSRNEVEDLLRAMEGAAPAAPPPAQAAAAAAQAAEAKAAEILAKAEAAAAKKPTYKQRVTPYDFKRPERVGKEQMRALQSLHEGLGRNFGASLSALLRSMVEVKLISVDQLTYSEFVYSLEIPTCFNLLAPKPLEGNWILDISPALLYPVIDRMLGGAASGESSLKRPLSEIELRLTSRITSVFLRELHTAWANVVPLAIEVERVENNPQLVQIVPPNEVVVLVSFEVAMGSVRGMTNLCIPFNTIERVGSKLTNNSWIGYASSRSNDNTRQQVSTRLDASQVPIAVSLAYATISTEDLFNLQVGDIIATEHDVNRPLEVEVAGVVKYLASPGALKGKKAIQIQEVLSEPPLYRRQ